jgi:hypothetical protein
LAKDLQYFQGVDFSGARLAGENMWVARLVPRKSGYELVELDRVAEVCGCAERGAAMRFLVDEVLRSEGAVWGMDFPFGLPIEIMPEGFRWRD